MDRPPHQHRFLADPFAKPERDLAPMKAEEADLWSDSWALEESPAEPTRTPSISDDREVYLRYGLASPAAQAPAPSGPRALASRVWAGIPSRLPIDRRITFDRRIVAGLVLVGAMGALLLGLSWYDFGPSFKAASDTTYNTAVEGLASAASAARDLVGKGAVAPVTTSVASISPKKVPSVRRATEKRAPIDSSRALAPVPLFYETVLVPREDKVPVARAERVPVFRDERAPVFRDERVVADAFAAPGRADVDAGLDARRLEIDTEVEAPIIYSSIDTDVRPPVAVRTPGIATVRNNGDKYVSFVEILVSETGQVESARGRQRPGSLGAALQSNTALSVVKTWRFRPARKNGQPVKYRTTVPFIETFNPAGTTDATR
jgi:hypothetical protein